MTTWSAPTRSSARAATPRWCASTAPTRASRSAPTARRAIAIADPYEGGKQAVAECYRNLTRGRRDAARDHQLPQFRQPAAARDHGPDRRLPRGHGRGVPRARLPDRVGQRLALQRDQGDRRRERDPADPRDRRHRPARSDWSKIGDDRVQGGRRGDLRDRREPRPSRPVAVAARDRRPRGRPAAAGRSRQGSAPRASSCAR